MNKVQRYLEIVEQLENMASWTIAYDELIEEADELWHSMDDEQTREVLMHHDD